MVVTFPHEYLRLYELMRMLGVVACKMLIELCKTQTKETLQPTKK